MPNNYGDKVTIEIKKVKEDDKQILWEVNINGGLQGGTAATFNEVYELAYHLITDDLTGTINPWTTFDARLGDESYIEASQAPVEVEDQKSLKAAKKKNLTPRKTSSTVEETKGVTK